MPCEPMGGTSSAQSWSSRVAKCRLNKADFDKIVTRFDLQRLLCALDKTESIFASREMETLLNFPTLQMTALMCLAEQRKCPQFLVAQQIDYGPAANARRDGSP